MSLDLGPPNLRYVRVRKFKMQIYSLAKLELTVKLYDPKSKYSVIGIIIVAWKPNGYDPCAKV